MADYRRLISYIYEYEGKQKGKNVGFAKLEARNGQCRINVNVKRIYMGGNAIGAYLLGTGGRETFLGNVFVRGGNGEFRVNVDAKNVEGSGTGLDTYFGLSVHDVKNSWRCYKTIWEDALAAEVDALVAAIDGSPGGLVLVSNEVGSGIVPADPGTRMFRDWLGIVNARVAAACDRAYLIVAGQALPLQPLVGGGS